MPINFTDLDAVLEISKEVVADAVIDTLQIIPFLLLTYLLLEFMEHKMSQSAINKFKKAGKFSPLIGSAFGALPQCGFSSAASTLYAGRVITIGTLFAVYLSTSDEMIPIFIAGGIPPVTMFLIVLAKFVLGCVIGYAIDFSWQSIKKKSGIKSPDKDKFEIHKLCERDQCSCDHKHGSSNKILKPAILHTVQVTLFVFLITLALNVIIEISGGIDTMTNFVQTNKYLSVVASSLIGLIPNCAASVAISQLYVNGVLGLGAMLAGLLDAAGVGLIVLFRNNTPMKQNFIIVGVLLIISIAIGLLITLFIG